MDNDMIPLTIDDQFQFACGPDVPCFNACCRDLNQFLTPYDIYRLKSRLDLSSSAFLSQYTVTHLGPQTGLPVISLKAVPDDDLQCPFVADDGCQVYEDRPSSCRTYPLARAITRSRETGEVTEHFALMREAHCSGCEQSQSQTVREWIEDQELDTFNRFNDMLMTVISLKNARHPSPLDIREQRMFHLALYDLDGFRHHLQRHGLPEGLAVSEDTLKDILSDDVKLLEFGHRWIQHVLFAGGSPR